MKRIYAQLAISISLTACSKGSSDEKPAPQPEQSNFTAIDAGKLKGKWITGCFKYSELGILWHAHAQSFRRFLVIEDGKFSMTSFGYSTDNCADNSIQGVFNADGTYELEKSAAKMRYGSEDKIGTGVLFKMESAEAIALNEDAAKWMNADAGTCNKKDWAPAQSVNVLGMQNCDTWYTAGLVPFNAALLLDDKLVLGSYFDGDGKGFSADKKAYRWSFGEEFQKTEQDPEINIEVKDPSPKVEPVPTTTSQPDEALKLEDILSETYYQYWFQGTPPNYPTYKFKFSRGKDYQSFGREFDEKSGGESNSGTFTFKSLSPRRAQIQMNVQGSFGTSGRKFDWTYPDVIKCLLDLSKKEKVMVMKCNKNMDYPKDVTGGLTLKFKD